VTQFQAAPVAPEAQTQQFYVDALLALDKAEVPYVVGGGYAMAYYTGIRRSTKDLDIFVKPDDCDRCLTVLTAAGYKTEFFMQFWIAKAINGESFIDILYNSGNGICVVDGEWISNSKPLTIHGYGTRLVPAEEQLWSKAFVMDRDRFDGTDVIHLILARGREFDWQRLLRRFNGHERVLLAHIIMFGYAYPSERDRVPAWVLDQLQAIVRDERPITDKVCMGTNVAQRGYGTALRDWGYTDGRLKPYGPLTPEEVAQLPSPDPP
jgi:hypothetical protein